jgi:hypothetical protein
MDSLVLRHIADMREKYSFIGALVYLFTLSMDLPTRVHSLRRHSTSRSAGLSVLLLASSTIRHSCKVLIAGPCFAGRAVDDEADVAEHARRGRLAQLPLCRGAGRLTCHGV